MENLETKIFISGIFALILVALIGVQGWIDWIVDVLISTLISLFFITPIVKSIVSLSLPKEVFIFFGIGFNLAIIYIFAFDVSLYEFITDIIKSVILVSSISLIFNSIYKYLEKKIPP